MAVLNVANAYTVLTVTGMGVVPYSARGVTQSLTPIAGAGLVRRTINGALKDVSMLQFRKFSTTISGADQEPPAFGGVWPGMPITIESVAEVAVISGTIDRPAVAGSARVVDGITYYRPILTCLLTSWTMDADEWAAGVNWSFSAEEV